jgi:hypothetical protein
VVNGDLPFWQAREGGGVPPHGLRAKGGIGDRGITLTGRASAEGDKEKKAAVLRRNGARHHRGSDARAEREQLEEPGRTAPLRLSLPA